jgi:protein-tyrosine phosphatase
MITKILRKLYQGNYEDTKENVNTFDLVFSVCDVPKYSQNQTILYLADGENTNENYLIFIKAINLVYDAYNSFNNIAIHCHAGLSRSPAITIGTLIHLGMTFDDAYIFAQEKMPYMFIEPIFIKWLQQYATDLDKRHKSLYNQ